MTRNALVTSRERNESVQRAHRPLILMMLSICLKKRELVLPRKEHGHSANLPAGPIEAQELLGVADDLLEIGMKLLLSKMKIIRSFLFHFVYFRPVIAYLNGEPFTASGCLSDNRRISYADRLSSLFCTVGRFGEMK